MFVTIHKVLLNRLGYGDEIRQVEIKGVATEIRLFFRQELLSFLDRSHLTKKTLSESQNFPVLSIYLSIS